MNKIALCILVVGLLFGRSAFAFETPVTTEKERVLLENMGDKFQSWAGKLGCDYFSWATVGPKGTSLMLEYIPEGDKAEAWTRMMTVTLFPLAGEAEEDRIRMKALASRLLSTYKSNAKVLTSNVYSNERTQETALFLEYEMGAKVLKEHNAGVFMRVNSRMAAFVQIQARGDTLSKEDKKKVHGFLSVTVPE